jgi:hypothetical protein
VESNKALVRKDVERINGVSRTWFEWSLEGPERLKTLVVEVEFDTDPNSSQFRENVLDAIGDTVVGVLRDDTTMVVSHLKIVPKG